MKRDKIYLTALKIYGKPSHYMCDCVAGAVNLLKNGNITTGIKFRDLTECDFPELFAFKPKEYNKVDLGWFDDDDELRKTILAFCIAIANKPL